MQNSARVCAWWTVAAGAVIIVVRFWRYRTSLVCAHGRGPVARRAAWVVWSVLSACRRDLRWQLAVIAAVASRFLRPSRRNQRFKVKTIAIILGVVLILAAAFRRGAKLYPARSETGGVLAAKDENGKPIISPEQRTYFNGLNDNLKELLNQAVEKEIITRPEHLADAAGA